MSPYGHPPRGTGRTVNLTPVNDSATPISVDHFGDPVQFEPASQVQDTETFLDYIDLPLEMQLECTSSSSTTIEAAPVPQIFDLDPTPWLSIPSKPFLTLSTATVQQPSPHRTLMRRGAHSRCPLTSMVLGQIMSYPRLLIEGDQLPPFIHPRCYVEEELAHDCVESDGHICLHRRLSSCVILVKMFYEGKNKESSFVWDVIRRETDEIHEQVLSELLDAEDQLAALQALTILLPLQAEAPASASEHGAGNMIEAILTLVTQMKARHAWDKDLPEGRPDRKDWILRESLRRIIALLTVIDLLLEGLMSSSTTFRHEFSNAPLPSPRTLWNARTNRRWRVSYDQWRSSKKVSNGRLLTVSDLVDTDEAGCFSGKTLGEMQREGVFGDVVRWCEGADALGTLVWMAMPFEQHRRRTVQ
ncbi:hypothetical protein LIA77_01873 [Sarocladium implicatum]|nr:hypothetical protein LIA77_01873 [Sarocladium implicatum]